jgi:hypothetical protein
MTSPFCLLLNDKACHSSERSILFLPHIQAKRDRKDMKLVAKRVIERCTNSFLFLNLLIKLSANARLCINFVMLLVDSTISLI